jgi:hypothetical protein
MRAVRIISILLLILFFLSLFVLRLENYVIFSIYIVHLWFLNLLINFIGIDNSNKFFKTNTILFLGTVFILLVLLIVFSKL